jgi:hypothetical protein
MPVKPAAVVLRLTQAEARALELLLDGVLGSADESANKARCSRVQTKLRTALDAHAGVAYER